MELSRTQEFMLNLYLNKFDNAFALNLTSSEKLELAKQVEGELKVKRWLPDDQNRIRSYFHPILGGAKL